MYDMYPYMYMHAMNTPKGGSHRYRKGLGREQKVDLAARDGHAGAAVVAACPPCSTCTLSALERSVIECCRCVDRHGRQFKVQTRRRDCVQAAITWTASARSRDGPVAHCSTIALSSVAVTTRNVLLSFHSRATLISFYSSGKLSRTPPYHPQGAPAFSSAPHIPAQQPRRRRTGRERQSAPRR